MKTILNANIQIGTLLRVFHEFKHNPKKIFVARDFFKSNPKLYAQRYFNTLIKLGIIERLHVRFYNGVKFSATQDAIGYRIKRLK